MMKRGPIKWLKVKLEIIEELKKKAASKSKEKGDVWTFKRNGGPCDAETQSG
jgi:hypothetical protein